MPVQFVWRGKRDRMWRAYMWWKFPWIWQPLAPRNIVHNFVERFTWQWKAVRPNWHFRMRYHHLTRIKNQWGPQVQKTGHLLIVTVVPVARLKLKPCPAGTVKPLSVIVVHFTALATSVDVRTMSCSRQQPWRTWQRTDSCRTSCIRQSSPWKQ